MRRTEEGEGGGEMLSQRSCRDHCTPSALAVSARSPSGWVRTSAYGAQESAGVWMMNWCESHHLSPLLEKPSCPQQASPVTMVSCGR